jgi:hypothetical protein
MYQVEAWSSGEEAVRKPLGGLTGSGSTLVVGVLECKCPAVGAVRASRARTRIGGVLRPQWNITTDTHLLHPTTPECRSYTIKLGGLRRAMVYSSNVTDARPLLRTRGLLCGTLRVVIF